MIRESEYEELQGKLQTDPEPLIFHGKHCRGESFSKFDEEGAKARLAANFATVNQVVSDSEWSVGDAYSFVEISLFLSIATLSERGFDFFSYSNLEWWNDVALQRSQFGKAVL